MRDEEIDDLLMHWEKSNFREIKCG
jgi:hypothetical protein